MEEISTEQKLQLVQQIRSQYHRNQYDMLKRERILYGKASAMSTPLSNGNSYEQYTPNEVDITTTYESLKFRCAVAAVFFIFAVVFDLFGVQPFGLKMEQIFTYIAVDYQENVSEYMETITNDLEQ